MAIFKSTYFTSIRGSLGGTTFYPTPVNPICGRSRVHPRSSQSPYQLLCRNAFRLAVAGWPLLLQADRVNAYYYSGLWHNHDPLWWPSSNGRLYWLRNMSAMLTYQALGAITYTITPTNGDGTYWSYPDISGDISVTPGTYPFIYTRCLNYTAFPRLAVVEISPPQLPGVNRYYGSYDWHNIQSAGVDAATSPVDPGITSFEWGPLLHNRSYFFRLRMFPIESQGFVFMSKTFHLSAYTGLV